MSSVPICILIVSQFRNNNSPLEGHDACTQPQAAVFQKLSMVEDEQWSTPPPPSVTFFYQGPILSSWWKEGHWCMDECSYWSLYSILALHQRWYGDIVEVAGRFDTSPTLLQLCMTVVPNVWLQETTLGVKHRWSPVCCTGHTLQLNSALEHPNIEKANGQQIISNIWVQAHSGHKHKAEQHSLRVHDELTAFAKVARGNAVHVLCCYTEELLKSTQMSANRSASVGSPTRWYGTDTEANTVLLSTTQGSKDVQHLTPKSANTGPWSEKQDGWSAARLVSIPAPAEQAAEDLNSYVRNEALAHFERSYLQKEQSPLQWWMATKDSHHRNFGQASLVLNVASLAPQQLLSSCSQQLAS